MNIKSALTNFNPYSKKTFFIVSIFAPFYFGLISVLLGADKNWDMLNYHIYNPFAFLNNKMQIDLAPAGMQSYFNPFLDIPYYVMTVHFPAPLVGFIMGTVHGFNFSLLAALAYKSLPTLPEPDRFRIPLLLALFGCLTANYLSGIGNSMGDNTTSIFILASLLVIIANWERIIEGGGNSIVVVILAGVVAGMGAGLKLTNGPYLVALCLSFCVVPVPWTVRLRLSLFFGIGVLVGLAVTAGYWFYKMWTTFGNPLYPQFGRYFHDPLLKPDTIHDLSWVPKNFTETLLWPFIFSIDASRVGELFTRQIIWVVAYVVVGIWAITALAKKRKVQIKTDLPASAQFLLSTIVIGYIIWMELFSIQRYLVPLEVCLPLILFILFTQLVKYRYARPIAITTLMVSTAVMVGGGLETWGHASWSDKMFKVDIPKLESESNTTVILVGDQPVFGWIVTQFPSTVAFVAAGNSFAGITNMPVYIQKMHHIVNSRGGPLFAIMPAFERTDEEGVSGAEKRLQAYGYSFDVAGCSEHSAFVGDQNLSYWWCKVTKL